MDKNDIRNIIKWVGNKTTVGGYSERAIDILTEECAEALWNNQANEAQETDATEILPHVNVRCSNCKNFTEERDDDYRWKFVSCSEGEFHMMRVNSGTLETFKTCDKFNAR